MRFGRRARTAVALALLIASPLLSAVVDTLPAGAATPPPTVSTLNIVALGDSFSSGVGALTAQTTCGRSIQTWSARALLSPYLLGGLPYTRGTYNLLACAGTTSAMVLANQVPFVNSTQNVATLTVGGNDIGFTGLVAGCVGGVCPSNVFSLFASSNGTLNWALLETRLTELYVAIRNRMAVDGHLYVATYPIPFGVSARNCNGFTTAEQRAANALVTRLDDSIVRAIRQANASMTGARHGNVHVVEWRPPLTQRIVGGYTVPAGYFGAGRTYDTYDDPTFGMCNTLGNGPSMQGVVLTFFGNSFHPSVASYGRVAGRLSLAIRTFQPPPA